MDKDEFLQLVYDRFRADNTWPLVRALQVTLRPLNVKLLAAEVGTDFVACEEGPDGVCFLRLKGLERCPKAIDDVELFLATSRLSAHHYIKHGTTPITSYIIPDALQLLHDA